MTQVGDRLEHAIEERADVEHEIERGEAEQPARKKLVRTVFWLAVTGISLYLVAPSLLDTLGSWDDLDRLSPAWLGRDVRAPGRRRWPACGRSSTWRCAGPRGRR